MVILGISDGHDSGAALLLDGKLVFAASEERFTRRKHAQGFPVRAIGAALAESGVSADKVDEVAVAGRHGRAPYRLLDRVYRSRTTSRAPQTLSSRVAAAYENRWAAAGGPLSRLDRLASRSAYRALLADAGLGQASLSFLDHHRAHLATAALMRGVAAVGGGEAEDLQWLAISLDGFGDGLSGAVAEIGAERTTTRPGPGIEIPWQRSLGVVYGIVTELLGFEEGDEGKVTGLAAGGDPGVLQDLFRRAIPFVDDPVGWTVDRAVYSRKFWLPALRAKAEDVAAALQKRIEEAVLQFVEKQMNAARATSLACAGGLFANVALNGRLAEWIVRRGGDLAVFPHMGDGGLCVGAAILGWHDLASRDAEVPVLPPFWGPAYDPARAIEAARARGLCTSRPPALHAEIARRLASGEVVARFEGRLEFGPRALGGRSILFAATGQALAHKVNETLGRPGFMPFGPALLEDEAGRLFDPRPPPRGCAALMTATARASAAMRERYPVAVHVDGSARPQVVDGLSSDLGRILLAYREVTGLGLLMNTSFNRHTEPIVCTPEEAVETYARCPGVDALAVGPYLIERG